MSAYAADRGEKKILAIENFESKSIGPFIAPRRQARNERLLLISPNLGGLCASARVTIIPSFLIRIGPRISNVFG
jgi:hypothetical protein